MDDLSRPDGSKAEATSPAMNVPSTAREGPPPSWGELVSLLAIVLLADTTIYRGGGYSGWAAMLAATPALLFAGAARRRLGPSLALFGAMLLLAAAKLLWSGTLVAIVVGTAVIPLYAMSLAGRRPYILDAASFTASLVSSGARGFAAYGRSGLEVGRRFAPLNAITIALPAAVGIAFSLVFVLANPDLVQSVSESLSRFFDDIRGWLSQISVGECLFLLGVAWTAVGLLRPTFGTVRERADLDSLATHFQNELAEIAPRPLYLAWRNTLTVVISIYAVYLAFEFRTLWFRVFPNGFYYSGYAHEGAAWLTIGLALATSILSLIFRGRILQDRRVGRLQWLALVWSIENFFLAASVYNRLLIYIRFNGLTNMRIVGLYGVSAVVVGFLLVLLKIVLRRDFAWLLQRHLWTVSLAVYLYALTPVDLLTTRYNVDRVLAGDLAPSVQLSEHPLSAEGLLELEPLLSSSNAVIKDGVAALLDKRRAESEADESRESNWTAFQLSEARFRDRCRIGPIATIHFSNAVDRQSAWARFREYAYQWY